jgi:hypothetical protein
MKAVCGLAGVWPGIDAIETSAGYLTLRLERRAIKHDAEAKACHPALHRRQRGAWKARFQSSSRPH